MELRTIPRVKSLPYHLRLLASSISHTELLLPKAPPPLLVTVNLTENCQAKCRSCNYWMARRVDTITTQRAKDLVAELVDQGIKYFRVLGGEPLLRRDLFDILAVVPKNAFAKVVLGTNGLLLGKFAGQVNDSCFTNITVSLDAVGRTNDFLRGIDGYYDLVLRNLDLIRGKRIKIASVLTRYLADDIDTLLRLCKERGYDHDICLPNRRMPFSATDEIMDDLWPSPAQADKVLDALERHGMISRPIAEGARRYIRDGTYPEPVCVLGYVQVIIRANGDLHLGCHDLRPVGNIRQSTLSDIFRSSVAADTAKQMYRLGFAKCPCSWQVDRAYSHPLESLPYIGKRLATAALRPSDEESGVAPN